MNIAQMLAHFCGIKNCCLKAICFFVLVNFSFNGFSQQLAFPEAQGFGKYATGGRGGTVIKVTNLNNSGAGSLRSALNTTGTRTVVFEVGGTITLLSPLYIEDGDVTVAGQTAPGGGILLRGSRLEIRASNVIVRYLRIRVTPDVGDIDGISIVSWNGALVEDIIIDHCSISWATDENIDVRVVNPGGEVRDITFQNSIISEGIKGSLMAGEVFNVSYYNNLFAHNGERSVRSNYPIDGTFAWEMVNNLIYGFGGAATMPSFGTKFSVINNKYKVSSETSSAQIMVDITTVGQTTPSETYAYVTGNDIPAGKTLTASGLDSYLQGTPFATSNSIIVAATELEGLLLNNVGASLPSRDSVDDRLIAQYNDGDGTLEITGTYPIIMGGTAPTDSDNDGMPDFWEIENGLDINDPTDRNIVQSDGYTNLEYYLNGIGTLPLVNAGDDTTICQGDSTTLTATGGSSYVWSTGETTTSITVNPTVNTTYSVIGTHNNGNTTTDDVTVFVNPIPNVDAGVDVTINVGESTTLTATGADTYLWDTGETTASITVSPTVDTIYSVRGITNSCESTDSVTVFSVTSSVVANAGEDTAICEGETTTLTASGGTDYLWNTGETTASINVNPTSTTNFTVIVSNSVSSDTDDVTVFVNPIPNVDAGIDVTINVGESTTLTVIGADTYEWDTGETTASITVNPIVDTTYSVTGTTNSCESTDSVTVFSVASSVVANAGQDTAICEGETTTLTASGGTDYLWNTGETTASITVNPSASTNYTVIVSNSISTDTDDVTVFVNPLPDVQVSNDATILRGTYITLSATGANTYEWSNGATEPNIAIGPNSTTTYEVTGYINDCSGVAQVTVEVLEQVTANAGEDFTVCAGDEVTLTASGGDSYIWNTGENTQSITVSPSEETTYTVIVSNALDSDADEATVFIDECIDENEKQDDFQFIVFPNPTTNGILNIKLFGLKNLSSLYIHDIIGKLVLRENLDDNNGQTIQKQIDISSFSKGMYFITLFELDRTTTKKIIFN